jgi:hypothetical protein
MRSSKENLFRLVSRLLWSVIDFPSYNSLRTFQLSDVSSIESIWLRTSSSQFSAKRMQFVKFAFSHDRARPIVDVLVLSPFSTSWIFMSAC